MGHYLTGLGWEIVELDILLCKSHDLTKSSVRLHWRSRIVQGEFQALIGSPPCDTFTRVQFANSNGPAPKRNFREPRGFSWLQGERLRIVQLGNILSDFTMEAIQLQAANVPGLVFIEFPEDLGAVRGGPNHGIRPASFWQWPEMEVIRKIPGFKEMGILQSTFLAPYLKPTRILVKGELAEAPAGVDAKEGLYFQGPPTFCQMGFYLGPIPHRSASAMGLQTLARKAGESGFRTTGTAAWPPKLCQWAANCLHLSWTKHQERNVDYVGVEAISFPDTGSLPDRSFPVFLPHADYWKGGMGEPRSTYMMGKVRQYHDGAGLTSPGRWDWKHRIHPSGKRWDLLASKIHQALLEHTGTDGKAWGTAGIQKALLKFCCTPATAVFTDELLAKGRKILKDWVGQQCGDFKKAEPDISPGQPFTLDLISYLLRELKDPDYLVFGEGFKNGVTAGIMFPLPRNPVIFEEQTSWRLKDALPLAYEAENYVSLDLFKDKVEKLFGEEKEAGMMDCCSYEDFHLRFPGQTTISALAVVEEQLGKKIRVLHDGTNTVHLNNKIRCRDKLRNPGVAEKHVQMRERRHKAQIVLSVLMDFSKAHRRVIIRPEERGHLACRLDQEKVWWNCTGTFGISSAAYWWARLLGGLVRLAHGLFGKQWPLELLAYADDVEATAGTEREREGIVLVIFLWTILGAPLKLGKFRGGFQVDWIGLAIDNRIYALGISLSRAAWVVRWTDEVVKSKSMEVISFAGGVGRINFAANALLYERPWLGPLYAWSSTMQLSGAKSASVPWGVKFILFWIAKRLGSDARLLITPTLPVDQGFLFKSDAKAENGRATIGGWECRNNTPTKKARWFFVELFSTTTPWVFQKAGDPGRVIATLELLGTLLCLAVFDYESTREHLGIITVSGTTDNQGNSLALQKFMTTKWPLAPMMIEMTEQLRKRKLELHLTWERRDKNVEADAITNECFELFEESNRIHVDFPSFPWLVLDKAMVWSKEVYDITQAAKVKVPKDKLLPTRVWQRKRTAANKRLRCTDPW